MPQDHSVTFSNIANVPMMMAFLCSQMPPKCPIVHHMCHFMTIHASHCHHGPVFALITTLISTVTGAHCWVHWSCMCNPAHTVGCVRTILRMWNVKNVTQCSYLCSWTHVITVRYANSLSMDSDPVIFQEATHSWTANSRQVHAFCLILQGTHFKKDGTLRCKCWGTSRLFTVPERCSGGFRGCSFDLSNQIG